MRILHVVEVSTGGVVSVVRSYAAAQQSAGHDVHLLVPEEFGEAAGVRHVWWPQRRTPYRWPAAVSRFHEVVSATSPDVVHLQSFFPGLLGRLRRPDFDGVVVYQPHSWAFDAVPRPARPLVEAWERTASSKQDLLMVNCEDERLEGLAHGVSGPTVSVGVPIDTTYFTPGDPDPELLVAAGIPPGPVITCVGRISRQKAQDLLVAAWERAPLPGATLVLLGGGDTAELERLAPTTWGSSIRSVGATTDVRAWLRSSRVLVMPSRYEGQSVAMGEALACGRPVFATKVNGATEAIVDGPEGPAGAVVDVGAVGELLRSVARSLDDEQATTEMMHAARVRAERLFAAGAVMQRVTDAYAMAQQLDTMGGGTRA